MLFLPCLLSRFYLFIAWLNEISQSLLIINVLLKAGPHVKLNIWKLLCFSEESKAVQEGNRS